MPSRTLLKGSALGKPAARRVVTAVAVGSEALKGLIATDRHGTGCGVAEATIYRIGIDRHRPTIHVQLDRDYSVARESVKLKHGVVSS
jgi:hypothetical protein